MDTIFPALITIYIRGGISELLVIGGIYALYIGWRMFNAEKLDTIGISNTIEFGPFKANTKTVGSFVMITACIWGYLAVQVTPTYKTQYLEVSQLKEIDELNKKYLEQIKAIEELAKEIAQFKKMNESSNEQLVKLITREKLKIVEIAPKNEQEAHVGNILRSEKTKIKFN